MTTNTLSLNRKPVHDEDKPECHQERASRLGVSIESRSRKSRVQKAQKFENEHTRAQMNGNVNLDNVNVVGNVSDSVGNMASFENDDDFDQQALMKANQLSVSDQNPFYHGDDVKPPAFDKPRGKKRGMGLFGRHARKARNKAGSGYSRYE